MRKKLGLHLSNVDNILNDTVKKIQGKIINKETPVLSTGLNAPGSKFDEARLSQEYEAKV